MDDDIHNTVSAFVEQFKNNCAPTILAIFTAFTSIIITGLTLFHIYLSSIKMTTMENIRGIYPYGNPTSRNFFNNWKEALCCPDTRADRDKNIIFIFNLSNQKDIIKEVYMKESINRLKEYLNNKNDNHTNYISHDKNIEQRIVPLELLSSSELLMFQEGTFFISS